MSECEDENYESARHYNDTLFFILRKYRKTTVIECPEALEYLAKHPSVIAKDWWCFGKTRMQRLDQYQTDRWQTSTIIEMRAEIIKKYLHPYERKDWQYKSFAIHPCDAKTCPLRWCCIRAHVKTIVIPDDNVVI